MGADYILVSGDEAINVRGRRLVFVGAWEFSLALFQGCWTIISMVMERRSWGWPSASNCSSVKTAARSFYGSMQYHPMNLDGGRYL